MIRKIILAYRPHLIALFAVAVLVAGYLIYVISQPRELVDQINTAPASHTYVVPPDEKAQQSFVSSQENISAVAIEYRPEYLQPQQELEFSLRGADTTLARVVGPASAFMIDYHLPDLPNARWLKFNFDPVMIEPGRELVVQLRNASSQPLELPIQRDPKKYSAGELRNLPPDWRGDLGFQTFSQASWTQKLRLDLIEDSHFVRLLLIAVVALLTLIAWQIVAAWRAGQPLLPVQPCLFFFGLAMVFTVPLYTNMNLWGVWDWPEAVSHYSAARHSLAAGQFPLWNPYFCGGNPSWGNPQTYWPSPTFALTLILGDIMGTKIAITLYSWLGMTGMYLLARQLKINRYAALLPAVIFMGNGFLVSHLAAGQILWLTVAWIPWVVLFFLRSFNRPWNIVPAVIFYLLIFFEGRVHVVVYMTFLLLLLSIGLCFTRRRAWPIIRSLLLFAALVVGLGAIKILPTLDFLPGLQGTLGKTDGPFWNHLFEVWLTRDERLTYYRDWMILPWHEYAAYLGVIPLLAAVSGLLLRGQRTYAVIAAAGIIFLTIVTARAGQSLFDKLPVVSTLRNHGRSMIMVIFLLAVLAGWGTQQLTRLVTSKSARRLLLIGIALLVMLDFFSVAIWPLSRIFRVEALSYTEPDHGFYQVQSRSDIGYDVVQRQLGARNWCPPQLLLWNADAKIYARGDEEYQGEVYAADGSKAALQAFTANQFEVAVQSVASEGDVIFVNQKYASGWGSPEKELFADHGRIAFRVTSPDAGRSIHLRYWPKSFTVGILISLSTAMLLGALYVRQIIARR